MLLLISGSPSAESANSRFLRAIGQMSGRTICAADYLADLPVFQPGRDKAPWPPTVLRWRKELAAAEAVIFSTPAYLHNLPGVLKNALDWLASSGELDQKPALVFTFTPSSPRGERARQSLLWSLEALNTRVVAEAALYQNDVSFTENGDIAAGDSREMLVEALGLLP
ncbi:NADPH-dependent FMN reductase [Neolewinella agarilytica]|uniref:NAD(P)H-dependent FMN reductase n=1 Tax=Neolewinella agarilytica TaxID=478744 RepID=A0A1H9C9T2_9BACT|nr:NADPH-dependent FMN reductase [Neolewinella agarilytica]SEP97936.1 NAD(P)H-dependent FMN reductase [Neolewinella agarilytica]